MNKPRRKLLFFDWRHVECGRLSWLTGAGDAYGVGSPPEPMVEMHARPERVPYGVRLETQVAARTDPVAGWRGWGRIVHHEGMYRSWHLEIDGNARLGTGSRAQAEDRRSVVVCAVESADGFSWRESARCPIDLAGQSGFDGLTFLVDPHGSPEERYKLVYCARAPRETAEALFEEYRGREPRHQDVRILAGNRSCIFTAVSADGCSWHPVDRPLMMHPSDTDTTVAWDEELQRYVLYTRLFRHGRRWVGRAESRDFDTWGPIEPVIWPRLDDPPDYDVYLNGYTLYPRSREYRLMFPMIWHRYTERSEVRLYAGDDGVAWSRLPGEPVIAPGAPGAWDSEFVGGGKDLVPFGSGRVAIPYTGTDYPHKYPRWPQVWEAWRMGWAWWPEDRLSALRADREGELWVEVDAAPGDRLSLNMRTPRAGMIRVGLEGVQGRGCADCDPLVGDDSRRVVTWGGSHELKVTKPTALVLHIRMRCAELFAVEMAPAP